MKAKKNQKQGKESIRSSVLVQIIEKAMEVVELSLPRCYLETKRHILNVYTTNDHECKALLEINVFQ